MMMRLENINVKKTEKKNIFHFRKTFPPPHPYPAIRYLEKLLSFKFTMKFLSSTPLSLGPHPFPTNNTCFWLCELCEKVSYIGVLILKFPHPLPLPRSPDRTKVLLLWEHSGTYIHWLLGQLRLTVTIPMYPLRLTNIIWPYFLFFFIFQIQIFQTTESVIVFIFKETKIAVLQFSTYSRY